MSLGMDLLVLLLVVVVVVTVVGRATGAEVPLVDTEDGSVSGIVEESVKGRKFYSFYGIPFAQPPVRELRFKDPVPVAAWEGTRQASIPASPCLQPSYKMMGKVKLLGEEDCLYLNVFIPKVKNTEALPVMVWLHGGGFSYGSAQEYLPYVLLDQDVLLVVVQYRLGVLGFLSTEDFVLPGNLGLKDQTMALKWVQRNIHAFSGDKTRVTIFGESAGGVSVHFQMLTPKAEGLFSRAIMQSGTALCPWAMNPTPRKTAFQLAEAVGCPTDQDTESLLVCLQAVNATVFPSLLDNISDWHIMPLVMNPWMDGHYLPDHPAQLMLEGRHAKVDIISGVTKDEGALFALPALADKRLLEKLQNNFSAAGPASLQLVDRGEDTVALARQMYLHYLGTTHVTESNIEHFMKMLTDRHFSVCHDLTTTLHHQSVNTFRYELQHLAQLSLGQLICPSCDNEWVCHADDLYYLFQGGPFLTPPTAPQDRPKDLRRPNDLVLRDIMTTLWTNFAATGNPTPDTSLDFTWEPSTADNLHYLSLTPSPSMKPDNRKEARKFHNSLPIPENFILHPQLVEPRTHVAKDEPPSTKTEL